MIPRGLVCSPIASSGPPYAADPDCTEEAMPRGGGIKGTRPVDAYVGTKIRFRRNMLGISQAEMGERIGVTFQQVQKYEKGINRIGLSRILQDCTEMGIPTAGSF